MVDVPGEGRGGVGVEVEHVPVGVDPEERRVEAGVAEVVELLPEQVGEAARVGGGRRLRVHHRERLVQVLGQQRLVGLEDVGEEGAGRAVGVGETERAAGAAQPAVGPGVAQRVVHRPLLLRERRHRPANAAGEPGTAAYGAKIGRAHV